MSLCFASVLIKYLFGRNIPIEEKSLLITGGGGAGGVGMFPSAFDQNQEPRLTATNHNCIYSTQAERNIF